MLKKIKYKLCKHFNKKKKERSLKDKGMFINNEIFFENERIFDFKEIPIYFDLKIEGSNNKILLKKQVSSGAKIYINIAGNNHLVEIGTNFINQSLYISFVNCCRKISEGSSVVIGSGNKFNGSVYMSGHSSNGKKIVIGNNNLFAGGIAFHGNMDHLIFDIYSKQRINDEQDIVLNDNIWIGQEVKFLNKTNVPSNCVIGMRSLVNNHFSDENCLICGTPARVKKKNIMWSEAIDNFYLENINKPLV